MPVVVMAGPDDEIADLIDLVRTAKDPEVGLVVPPGSSALQTPLNAKLLSQFSRQTGRRTSIVSGDPRVQELARASGFSVYASVPAYERGIEAPVLRSAGNGTAALGSGLADAAAAATTGAAGVDAMAPAVAAPVGPPRRPPLATATATAARSRRPYYIAGGVAALIGLLLFFLLAPSATVTVKLAGTPLTVNPTIQGSTDATQATQGDHIQTAVLQATASSNFTATPSGQATLPATAASGTETINYSGPNGTEGPIPQGTAFQTADHSITFVASQSTYICIPPSGASSCGGQPPNNALPVQDQSPEAKGNVAANSVTYWPQDPCAASNNPNPISAPECYDHMGHEHDYYSVTNPAAMTGGADQRQQTVASSQDVSAWNQQVTQIENNLTNQLNSQLQNQLSGKTFAVDPGGGGKSLTFTVNPAVPSANAPYSTTQITVAGNAKGAAYSPADIKNDVLSDLRAQVSQGDQLAPNSLKQQPCQVTQAGIDGTVILSCAASDFSQPIVDLDGLRTQLSGKSPGDANKIIASKVDKVQDVHVSEFPFTLWYLPFLSSRISIDEQFMPQPASSS